jgi:hypothetical protein
MYISSPIGRPGGGLVEEKEKESVTEVQREGGVARQGGGGGGSSNLGLGLGLGLGLRIIRPKRGRDTDKVNHKHKEVVVDLDDDASYTSSQPVRRVQHRLERDRDIERDRAMGKAKTKANEIWLEDDVDDVVVEDEEPDWGFTGIAGERGGEVSKMSLTGGTVKYGKVSTETSGLFFMDDL